MNRLSLNRVFFIAAFVLGLACVAWVGAGFVGSSGFALAMTLLIGAVYLLGAQELRRYRQATSSLADALAQVPQPLNSLDAWLTRVPSTLQNAVRQRIEAERGALPGLALTPYLIGLLVMLGMLGTFLGMVVTFKGVVFTLEGSADLQAIRAALAAPIKGLGLAFGTSVVGVATSAMLGLMSAISRRERTEVARLLDAHTATVFRPFSLAHQRQTTFDALQQQANVLPEVAEKLHALIGQIERRNQHLDDQLLARQAQFHVEASEAYRRLAKSVQRSLEDSLSASARSAGESLQPVVEKAMAAIGQESARLHERVNASVQAQMSGLAERFGATAGTVADTWTAALQQHTHTSEQQAQGLDRALTAFTTTFEERCAALITGVQDTVSRSHAEQSAADREQHAAWTQALQAMASTLQDEWRQLGAQAVAQQQAAVQTLEQAASLWRDELAALRSEEAARGEASVQRLGELQSSLNGQVATHLATLGTAFEAPMARLLETVAEGPRAAAEVIAQLRQDVSQLAERDEARQQAVAQTLEQTATAWRDELAALRGEEAARAEATALRLGELQSSLNGQVASHLSALGAALEAPMARLLETAAEAPRAAAEVITQLRRDMSQLTERDNAALQERAALMQNIDDLLQSAQQATGAQQAAIESLVTSAGAVLDQVGRQFAETVGAQAVRAEDVAAQVNGSAIELASLGEAFGHGVQLFSSTNEKLIDSLQRIETAVSQSMARSDEQLAYYVAQAREVIDLSISSQQGIVEDLRRLRGPATGKKAAG